MIFISLTFLLDDLPSGTNKVSQNQFAGPQIQDFVREVIVLMSPTALGEALIVVIHSRLFLEH